MKKDEEKRKNKSKRQDPLVSTRVSVVVKKKLALLCKATKRTEANYVAALLEAHVDAVTPKLAAALQRSWAGMSTRTK